MTTKELRIGNILNYCGQIVYVMGIYPDNKVELGYFADSIGFTRSIDDKDLKPITLTEKLLIKHGFKKQDNNWKALDLHFAYISWEVLAGTTLSFEKEWIFLPHIKYFHKLQNLYHSLTGEELTPITP